MSGTLEVALAAKREIRDRLRVRPSLSGVQVEYNFPGRNPEREIIYFGKVEGTVALSAMALAGGAVARRGDPTIMLHIWVRRPGEDTTEQAEQRAAEIGGEVEKELAEDPTLGGAVNGLKLAAVSNVDLDSGLDDDDAVAELNVTIALISHIR